MPDNPYQEQIQRGEQVLLAGHPETALEIFRLVLSVDPANADALNDAGLAAVDLERPGEAAGYYERALEAAPHRTDVLLNLLDLLVACGASDVAREAYDRYADAADAGDELERYRRALFPDAPAAAEAAPAPAVEAAPMLSVPGPAAVHAPPTDRPKRHLFIVSQPRSGTTILWKTLRQDDRLGCFNEPFNQHLRAFVEAGEESRKGTVAEYLAVPDLVRNHWSPIQPYEEPFRRFLGHQADYLRALAGTAEHLCVDFIRVNTRLGDLRRLVPDAFIVHLVRDPRAWVTSHLRPYGDWVPGLPEKFFEHDGWFDYWSRQEIARRYGLSGYAHEQLLRLWTHFTDAAESAGPDLTLQFEDFARDPEPALRTLVEAVGLDYRPLDVSSVHAPNPPHRADDPRWTRAIEAHTSPSARRFVVDYDAVPA